MGKLHLKLRPKHKKRFDGSTNRAGELSGLSRIRPLTCTAHNYRKHVGFEKLFYVQNGNLNKLKAKYFTRLRNTSSQFTRKTTTITCDEFQKHFKDPGVSKTKTPLVIQMTPLKGLCHTTRMRALTRGTEIVGPTFSNTVGEFRKLFSSVQISFTFGKFAEFFIYKRALVN